MTIEEKLEHFKNISLENAKDERASILATYKQSLDDEFASHKITAKGLAEDSVVARESQVSYAQKKDLASQQLSIRKELTNKHAQIKSQIFDMVRKKLAEYRKSPEYIDYLTNQINQLVSKYHDLDITVYIDPDDSELLEQLKKSTFENIEIYDNPFYGGTRTIIPSMNILVDHSFKSRLSEAQENFTITL